MEPNIESNTTEKIETPAIKPEKPKGLIATTIILAILAIGGIATAIYFYLNASSEAANNSELQAKIKLLESETGSKLVEKNENNTKTTVVEQSTPPLSVAEATKLLEDKFDFHQEESTLCYVKLSCALDTFDKDKKIQYAINYAPEELFTNRREGKMSYIFSIKYDDLNSIYNKYFGSKENIEKEDYYFGEYSIYGKIKYLPESDSFDIEFKLGLGGTSPLILFNKVIETNKTQDGFSATVVSVIMNQAPTTEEYLEHYLEEAKESLSVHKFNFVEEDGDYKLVSIKKVEQ